MDVSKVVRNGCREQGRLDGGLLNRQAKNKESITGNSVTAGDSSLESGAVSAHRSQGSHLGETSQSVLIHFVQRLQQGDRDVLGDIWKYFAEDLRRRARTRLRQCGLVCQVDSMDICNTVFMDLFRQQKISIHSESELIGYLGRAIDNQVRDVVRLSTRARRDVRKQHSRPIESHELENADATPSKILMNKELTHKIAARLGVDGSQFVSLILSGHDWNEIGQKLGVEADAARMRWSRCIKRIRQELEVEAEVSR